MNDRRVPDPREVAAAYDRGAEGFDDRFSADPRTVRRFARLEAPIRALAAGSDRVLEVGCGTGRLLSSLDAPVRVGIDVSAGLLRRATRRRAAQLVLCRADAHRLPFPDDSFDVVVAGNAVFRDLDYDRALAESRRVLRRGGFLAVHQYAARTLGLGHRRPYNPRHLHSLDELEAPAERAGLVPDRVWLFRGIRAWPYLVPLPAVSAPLRLWDHAILAFRRP